MILDQKELKRRLMLRLKSIESERPLIGPATVEFHLTDVCNLSCRYCWYHGANSTYHPVGKNHFSFEVFESVARDCKDLQVDSIYLSGKGEPTLHPRFYDMLRCLENSFAVTLYSNGTFPIKRCRDILRADHIVINLGEADRESYRILQGKDLFVKVIKNIRELARLRPKFNPNFCIEVAFIANSLNIESLGITESMARKLGADIVRKKIVETKEHNHDIRLSDERSLEEEPREWPPCFHGSFYSAIQLNGDVCVCTFMRRVTMGNVNKMSFKDIWGSDDYSHARNSALTGNPFRNFQECINCRATVRNQEIAAQREMYNRVRTA